MSCDSPIAEELRAARVASSLPQAAAARLIHSTLRTWQGWKAGVARMHPGLWELFQIKRIRPVPKPRQWGDELGDAQD